MATPSLYHAYVYPFPFVAAKTTDSFSLMLVVDLGVIATEGLVHPKYKAVIYSWVNARL